MENEDDEYYERKDDTMSAVARNYVYEMKTTKTNEKSEKVISKKMLAKCKEVASKYPKK